VAEFVRFDFHSAADLDHLGAGLTIGEAATATIVEEGTEDSDYYATFRTCGKHHDLCQIPLPGADQFRSGDHGPHPPIRFYAYASSLHKAAIQLLVEQYQSDPRLTSYQPDIIFGHSPSVPASNTALRLLGFEKGSFEDPFPCYGNTVSASIPLAMSLAAGEGRLTRGAQVLAIVASAGISTAFCRFTY
jgi:3-oxoacyl-[acyl-carrier-protein] synthase III